MSLDSCKTYPRTAPHLLSTTRALELCLHPSAFPPRMSRHKSLSGKHWLFWHEPGRKRGVISFVFPQEKKKKERKKEKKSAKINIFASMVQPREKIWAHWGRNKDDGFASWHVRMLVCLVLRVCAFGLCRVLQLLHCFFCLFFLFVCAWFSELYM